MYIIRTSLKYKNMKLINRLSCMKKSLKTGLCYENCPKHKRLTVSKHCHIHKVNNQIYSKDN